MTQRREALEQVSHLVRLHHRGIICPSEMWLQMVEALTPATATAVLDSLPADAKEQLLAAWIERPPAAYICKPGWAAADDFQAKCVQIVRWCEVNGPRQESPTEPDWLIRVCVRDAVVREWQPEK